MGALMLAEEFGYQISPGPANRVPGIEAKISAGMEQRRANRGCIAVAWALFAVMAATVPCLALLGDELAVAVGVLLALGLCVGAFAWSAQEDKPFHRDADEMIRNRPWQVWPCRLSEARDSAYPALVVATVLLLAPDHSVAAAMQGLMRRSDWLSVVDGRGLIWFCGDLRVGGWAALPADAVGSLFWVNKIARPADSMTMSPRDTALEELVIRAATSEPVWDFLFGQ
ncbi:hypothetical protein [Streptomyces sp. NPDC001389]|uniref:hypothetical protein n=1 Tax=Streptomyces sp. NPDC001389 TaxID=3364569 RepID=UPI0036899720